MRDAGKVRKRAYHLLDTPNFETHFAARRSRETALSCHFVELLAHRQETRSASNRRPRDARAETDNSASERHARVQPEQIQLDLIKV
jgi:hypothetical protein